MNYKFCVKCGRKIDAGAPFCPHCGARQPVAPSMQRPRSVNNINYDSNSNYQTNPQPMNGTANQASRNSFGGSLADFFSNYANFSGRSTRSQYWFMFLWNLIFDILGGFLWVTLIGIPFVIIFWIVWIIPSISLCARRFRDAGMSNGGIVALMICDFLLFWTVVPLIISLIYTVMPSVPYPMTTPRPVYQSNNYN